MLKKLPFVDMCMKRCPLKWEARESVWIIMQCLSLVVHFTDLLMDIALNATLKKVKRDHAIVWQGQEGEK